MISNSWEDLRLQAENYKNNNGNSNSNIDKQSIADNHHHKAAYNIDKQTNGHTDRQISQ